MRGALIVSKSCGSRVAAVLLLLWCCNSVLAFTTLLHHQQALLSASEQSSHRVSTPPLFAVAADAEPTAASQAAVVNIALSKPLGLALEEMQPGKAAGVRVEDVLDGGSAKEAGAITPGMVLLQLNGT